MLTKQGILQKPANWDLGSFKSLLKVRNAKSFCSAPLIPLVYQLVSEKQDSVHSRAEQWFQIDKDREGGRDKIEMLGPC